MLRHTYRHLHAKTTPEMFVTQWYLLSTSFVTHCHFYEGQIRCSCRCHRKSWNSVLIWLVAVNYVSIGESSPHSCTRWETGGSKNNKAKARGWIIDCALLQWTPRTSAWTHRLSVVSALYLDWNIHVRYCVLIIGFIGRRLRVSWTQRVNQSMASVHAL